MTVGQNEGRPYPTTTGGEMTDIDVMRELIESQRREIERLTAALRRIVYENDPDSTTLSIARAALEGK